MSDTYKPFNNISHDYHPTVATEIKLTNKCTNPDIIKLERQI